MTDKPEEELKSCAYCEEKNIKVEEVAGGFWQHYKISCPKCGRVRGGRSKLEVIAAWNRRDGVK